MSLKITLRAAAIRFGVNERTIYRWANKYAIAQFPDGTFDVHQLDALFNNYAKIEYLDIDWSKAACAGLPTDMFYKIEEKGVRGVIGVKMFRSICAPCPIWKQCLSYGAENENFGVWGGMTTDERRAVKESSRSDLKTRIIKEFEPYGITESMIEEAAGNR